MILFTKYGLPNLPDILRLVSDKTKQDERKIDLQHNIHLDMSEVNNIISIVHYVDQLTVT